MICGPRTRDTKVMDRERAETYLRVLAEAELRRATSQPWGNAQRAGYADRVMRVARVLAFVGALDEGPADQILRDFELALGARQAGQAASVAGRIRLARRVGAPAAAAGGSAAARSGTGTPAGRTYAPVPLGQMVQVRGADVDGEVCLLSYARVASGPQFSVFARERRPSGRWEPSGPRPSSCPNWTESSSPSLACTTARRAPSCTCTPAARHATSSTGRTNPIPGHRYGYATVAAAGTPPAPAVRADRTAKSRSAWK